MRANQPTSLYAPAPEGLALRGVSVRTMKWADGSNPPRIRESTAPSELVGVDVTDGGGMQQSAE